MISRKFKILTINSEDEILRVLNSCADSFFDQSFNNENSIKQLAYKFSNWAEFVSVELDDEICGFAAFYANDNITFTGYLSMVIVKEKFQGCGIGKFLINEFLIKSKEKGMKKVRLEVNLDNEKAIMIYQKNGFAISGFNDSTMYMERLL